jgi:hypothetical protein
VAGRGCIFNPVKAAESEHAHVIRWLFAQDSFGSLTEATAMKTMAGTGDMVQWIARERLGRPSHYSSRKMGFSSTTLKSPRPWTARQLTEISRCWNFSTTARIPRLKAGPKLTENLGLRRQQWSPLPLVDTSMQFNGCV